jgi:predicted RNA-binding Zn-ribbon protein involved in translation (DUF1610 family)
MTEWLRRASKVRAGHEPDLDLLVELFRSIAPQLKCPDCGRTGLSTAAATDEDADWPETRACRSCGKTIAPERLEAIPDAVFCAACQGKEESGESGDIEYCPKCGAPMALRLSRSPGMTRYVMACTNKPSCR